MKIYTKTGDQGMTSLYGGKRVSKASLRLEAYGTVDELNSFIGLLGSSVEDEKVLDVLRNIQKILFDIGSQLANDPEKPLKVPEVGEEDILLLEDKMDAMEEKLEPLKTFILPGGSTPVSHAHVCRTICRRAERRVLHLHESEPVDTLIYKYLNRLSDYFFMLSRYLAHQNGEEEIKWFPK